MPAFRENLGLDHRLVLGELEFNRFPDASHPIYNQFFPEMTVDDWTNVVGTEVPVMSIEVALPAPPLKIARPANPVPTPGVEVTATVPVFGFDKVTELPPPPPAAHNAVTGTSNGFVVFVVAQGKANALLFVRDSGGVRQAQRVD